MGDVLVTGGTGGLGAELVPRLLDAGHTVRITSRDASSAAPDGVKVYAVDLASGHGLARAVDSVDTIVHAATAVRGAKKVEVGGAARLLEAIGGGRPHLLYVSIVGVDRHPFAYYRAKWAAEQVLEAGAVPLTIQRATQFHTLLHGMLGKPISFLPFGASFQPIDVGEVAHRLVELVGAGPSGRAEDIGGPEVLHIDDLLSQWADVFGARPRCFTVPAAGKTLRAFGQGIQTCPDHRYGTITWHQFLEAVAADQS